MRCGPPRGQRASRSRERPWPGPARWPRWRARSRGRMEWPAIPANTRARPLRRGSAPRRGNGPNGSRSGQSAPCRWDAGAGAGGPAGPAPTGPNARRAGPSSLRMRRHPAPGRARSPAPNGPRPPPSRRRGDGRPAAGGWIHSTPCSWSGSVRKNGEPRRGMDGGADVVTSGQVSSAERQPPRPCPWPPGPARLARLREGDGRGRAVGADPTTTAS